MDYKISIGEQIKTLRIRKKMTLKELGLLTDLSIGYLSQLERGLSSVAIDSLAKIAEILGTDLSSFFAKEITSTPYPVKKNYDLEFLKINENIIQFILSHNPSEFDILPRLFHLLPFSSFDEVVFSEYHHKGEEFLYVLEGVLTVYLKGEKHVLYPGDSIHFHSIFDHNWINESALVTKFIAINLPNPLKIKE